MYGMTETKRIITTEFRDVAQPPPRSLRRMPTARQGPHVLATTSATVPADTRLQFGYTSQR